MTVDHQFRYVEDIEDGRVVGMVGMGWPVSSRGGRVASCMHNPHNNNNTTERTRRESGFSSFLEALSECGMHSTFITMPDMVIRAVYASCLAGPERSARLRGALIHTY